MPTLIIFTQACRKRFVLVLTALVSIIVLAYTVYLGIRLHVYSNPLAHTATKIKLDLSLFRFNIEKVIHEKHHGKTRNGLDDALSYLESAERYTKAVLEKGANKESFLVSVTSPRLRANLSELLKGLGQIKGSVKTQRQYEITAVSGPDFDRFHKNLAHASDEITSLADRMDTAIQRTIAVETNNFLQAVFLLTVSTIVILLFHGWQIRSDRNRHKKLENAVLESETMLRAVFENAGDSITIIDPDSHGFIVFNTIAHESLGYTRKEFQELTISSIDAIQSKEEITRNIQRVIKEGTIVFETEMITKSGTIKVIQVNARVFSLQGKTCLLSMGRDVTEKKKAEQKLKKALSELQNLESIVNTSPVMVFLWPIREDWPVEFVSTNVERLLGYPANDFMSGKVSWPGITFPEDIPRLEAEIAAYIQKGTSEFCQEYRLIKKSGEVRWMRDQNRFLYNSQGTPTHIQSIVTDCTDRKRAEEELLSYQTQLRDLALQQISTEETQRQLFSTQLHDCVGQTLVAAKVETGILCENLSSREHVDSCARIIELIGQAMKDVWSLTYEIYPPMLYEVGIGAALEWLINQFQNTHDIIFEYEDSIPSVQLAMEVRGFLFQAVRELLINAVKHSKATSVKISDYLSESELVLSVKDNGVGFDQHEYQSGISAVGKFGLFSIRERVKRLGGEVAIDSEKGHGSMITLSLPRDDFIAPEENRYGNTHPSC